MEIGPKVGMRLSALFDRTHVSKQEVETRQQRGDRRGVETPRADFLAENFDKVDLNSNGQLGRLERRMAVARLIDQDGSSTFSAEELSQARDLLQSKGKAETPRLDFLVEKFSELDTNADAELSREESVMISGLE